MLHIVEGTSFDREEAAVDPLHAVRDDCLFNRHPRVELGDFILPVESACRLQKADGRNERKHWSLSTVA